MAYQHPATSEIWGADMSRGTFRRFVEADAREQRTLNHIRLARARESERVAQLEDGAADQSAVGGDCSSGIALDEFRLVREFPTLLKIVSTQSSETRHKAGNTTVVDTARFSTSLRGDGAGATGATANSSRASRKAKRNRGKAEGPILCIDTISAIPNTNSSGARVPVRYGNVVRMRSQRSYLQGTALVESVHILSPSNKPSSSSSSSAELSSPAGTVSSVPRVVDVSGRVPAAVAAAAAAATLSDDDVDEGLVWRIERIFSSRSPSLAPTNASHVRMPTPTVNTLANDTSNETVRYGDTFRLVLVTARDALGPFATAAETPEHSSLNYSSERYVLCASLDATSLLSRPSSRSTTSSSRPSSRSAGKSAASSNKTGTRKKKQKKKKKKASANADPPPVRTARVFLCTEDDPRCNATSSAWCFSGGASEKIVIAERQVRLQSMLWAGRVDLAVDLAQPDRSRSKGISSFNSSVRPGSQALLHCSDSGSGHVSLVIDDRGTALASGGVPAPRGAAFNWFVEPLPDPELLAKGLLLYAPRDAQAASVASAEREQRQHRELKGQTTKARKRSFVGRSPSKPLPSPPAPASMSSLEMNAYDHNQQRQQKQLSSSSTLQSRLTASTPATRSPRSRRIANKAAAASAEGRSRRDGQMVVLSERSGFIDGRPPFSPCSPFKAREAISRKGKELSISVDDPYSALQDKKRAEDKARVAQRLGGDFKTAVPFATHNRYVKRSGPFLHSPDRKCMAMEQDFLKLRAKQGLLKLEERSRRSKKRWAKTNKVRMELEERYM